MNPILKSLEAITTGYSVFEKDQVLTHDQLNSVADYFDDQTRLTRVKLLGVGIVCGLRVSVQANDIAVTKGAGVTTDGDLLYFAADSVFDKFKVYDESNPVYGPFYPDGTLIKGYELVPQGTVDPRATTLSRFAAQTGSAPGDMVAVLFMEGYVKDEDLCSGTDCDNLGKDFVNTIKLLLVAKSSVGLLGGTATTPADAFPALTEIVAERPAFSSSITSPAQLAAAYRAVCAGIHNTLLAELAKIFPNCAGFLGGVFASDPIGGWTTKLNGFKSAFVADSGIQYYYDFLKDLVETYNAFRDLLFGENTWCCPDTNSLPKHLLLGNVAPGANPDENRTGFYPSPATSRTTGALEHAEFLAGKINTLIQTFELPASVPAVRITPSSTEERCLEERAIPYYYAVNATNPIQKSWNHALSQRGMGAWNYSYNAALYSAQGGAASPLTSQIGRFSFFRIEGHLGQDVATAQAAIEAEIKAKNLPFFVQSVLLGTDTSKVVKKPGIRYTDIHRLHQVLRKDLAYQLADVKTFSAHYTDQVGKTLKDTDVDDLSQVKRMASQKDQAIRGGVDSATGVLNQSYSLYKTNAAWKPGLTETMTAAAEFKQNLGEVTKTEFSTPFDSLISTSHAQWLDWLDIHIQDKNDKEDAKLLFSNFESAHPGLEHFAGVVRGGTFVLVHDGANKVVADFMLPYHCCEEPTEADPKEPALPLPPIKTPGVITGGIKLIPSLDKYVIGNLDLFTKNVVDPKINLQKDYLAIFKDVAGVLGNVKTGIGTTGGAKDTNNFLAALAEENRAKQRQMELLKEAAADPALPKEKSDLYTQQAKDFEDELGKSAQKIAKYVADSGVDVVAGNEAHSALLEVSKSYNLIRDAATRNTVKAGLSKVGDAANNASFKAVVGNIVMR